MINIFNNISDKNLPRLLKFLEAHTFTFKKDSKLLSSIVEDDVICIIKTGHLQIIRTDASGNTTIIEDLEENSVFGSFINSYKSNEYSYLVKEDLELYVIEFTSIVDTDESLSNTYHQFLKNIVRIMGEKIKENNERIEILTNKTIRNKLLTYFNIMAEKNNSTIIYLPYTFTNLASYLAVDRTAMAREIRNLKDEGLIEIKDKRIKILYYLD